MHIKIGKFDTKKYKFRKFKKETFSSIAFVLLLLILIVPNTKIGLARYFPELAAWLSPFAGFSVENTYTDGRLVGFRIGATKEATLERLETKHIPTLYVLAHRHQHEDEAVTLETAAWADAWLATRSDNVIIDGFTAEQRDVLLNASFWEFGFPDEGGQLEISFHFREGVLVQLDLLSEAFVTE